MNRMGAKIRLCGLVGPIKYDAIVHTEATCGRRHAAGPATWTSRINPRRDNRDIDNEEASAEWCGWSAELSGL